MFVGGGILYHGVHAISEFAHHTADSLETIAVLGPILSVTIGPSSTLQSALSRVDWY